MVQNSNKILMCTDPTCKPNLKPGFHNQYNHTKQTCKQHYSKMANHRKAIHKTCGRNSDKVAHNGVEISRQITKTTLYYKNKYPIINFC